EQEQYLRFLMGLVPRGLHRAYLVDPSRLDLAAKKGPSTSGACALCAGVVAAMAVKLLLNRPGVLAAPYHHHFDPYANRYVITKLRWGNMGPVARLKLGVARRLYGGLSKQAPTPAPQPPTEPLQEILNLARWAPSGDNVQPWRLAQKSAEHVVVFIPPANPDHIYEYRNGEPNLIAAGMLLESLRIAASGWQRRIEWDYEHPAGAASHQVDVRFIRDSGIEPDPLLASLPLRSVDRRPYSRRNLRPREKAELEQAFGYQLALDWHETIQERMRVARLGALATDIRLRAKEAFPIHQRIVDFARSHSPDAIPAGAVGLSRPTLASMRWAMRSWSRMNLFNRLGATVTAALEMDYITGLSSAAFFTMRLRQMPDSGPRAQTLLAAGQDIQRFWLTATRLRLALQPGLAIIAFAHYGETGQPFTADPVLRGKAQGLASRFRQVFGAGTDQFIFLGRIGEAHPRLPKVRSTRLSLAELTRARSLEAQSPEA
ncbi:MAG: nitroreductase family protein, partial [Acetobacteraceae bacterium]|nr:nitroreductase family protein [Acetobacteraceae bacterium]